MWNAYIGAFTGDCGVSSKRGERGASVRREEPGIRADSKATDRLRANETAFPPLVKGRCNSAVGRDIRGRHDHTGADPSPVEREFQISIV